MDTNDLSIVSADMDEIMTFPYPNYDGNTDGIVDILDLTLVSRNIMKLTQLCSTLSKAKTIQFKSLKKSI